MDVNDWSVASVPVPSRIVGIDWDPITARVADGNLSAHKMEFLDRHCSNTALHVLENSNSNALMGNNEISESNADRVISLIKQCARDDPGSVRVDDHGYDMVRCAVAVDALPFLQYLIDSGYSTVINDRCRTTALALTGYMDQGNQKVLSKTTPSFGDYKFRLPKTGKCSHSINCNENNKCLPILFEHAGEESRLPSLNPGSYLLHAYISHSPVCGRAFLVALCESGFKQTLFGLRDERSGNNLLHLIYLSRSLAECGYSTITEDLLELGFPTTGLNQLNYAQMSPLRALISNVSAAFHMLEIDDDTKSKQLDSLYHTVELLVQHGADVKVTTYGYTVLHSIFDNLTSEQLYKFRLQQYLCQDNDSIISIFLLTYRCVNRLIQYFLKLGVDVNYYCTKPVLRLFVDVIQQLSPLVIHAAWNELWVTIEMLLKHGANPNLAGSRDYDVASDLVNLAGTWLKKRSRHHIESVTLQRLVTRLSDMISLLFDHGLKGDVNVVARSQCRLLTQYTLERDCSRDVCAELPRLSVPFFVNGVDPHSLTSLFTVDGLSALFYLAMATEDHHRRFKDVLPVYKLLSNCLDQRHLNLVLDGVLTVASQDRHFWTSEGVACMQHLRQQVRPLTHLTRIAIAKALQWQIKRNTRLLPLPKLLRDFLCDFYP